MMKLGNILQRTRGKESRVQFARRLGLSYTFVRAMEHGMRHPSDRVLVESADRLGLDSSELLLAAYCDRSPMLARVLDTRGIEVEPGVAEETTTTTTEARKATGPQWLIRASESIDAARLREQDTPPPVVQVAYRF